MIRPRLDTTALGIGNVVARPYMLLPAGTP